MYLHNKKMFKYDWIIRLAVDEDLRNRILQFDLYINEVRTRLIFVIHRQSTSWSLF